MYIFDSDYFTVFQVINVRTGCLDLHPFKTDWVKRSHLFNHFQLFPINLFTCEVSQTGTFYNSNNVVIKRKKNRIAYEQAPMGKKNE